MFDFFQLPQGINIYGRMNITFESIDVLYSPRNLFSKCSGDFITQLEWKIETL